jgi:hypothetical protein
VIPDEAGGASDQNSHWEFAPISALFLANTHVSFMLCSIVQSVRLVSSMGELPDARNTAGQFSAMHTLLVSL